MATFSRYLLISYLMFSTCLNKATAQNPGNVPMTTSRFITGDNAAYKSFDYDDSKWEIQKTGIVWQEQGHDNYHGYAWYRIHVIIPSAMKEKAFWKDSLRIFLAHVNDVDETFLNGKRIGHIGSFPDEPGGYVSKWPAIREYHLPINDSAIKWDKDNVIAIRVYDGGGSGGIFMGHPYIDILEKINGIKLDNKDIEYISSEKALVKISIVNEYNTTTPGILKYSVIDAEANKIIENKQLPLILKPFEGSQFSISLPNRQGIEVKVSFTEKTSEYAINVNETFPYILTPPVSLFPKINGAEVFGVQPGHPVLYKIPATGILPIQYSANNLPRGLQLDPSSGIITGIITKEGDYRIKLKIKNQKGTVEKLFTIKVGHLLALTPPMGWNSWNCWGINVSEEKVKSSAQALIDKGLINHGWTYINIDDGWEASKRAADGDIVPNEKFPDMKGLGNFLHSHGLKFGIYSSPGPLTCGGFTGSYHHEISDATTYAQWGIDYLKYDLCSYLDKIQDKGSLEEQQLPYKVMQSALAKQNRDIVYSLCQYGIKNVWEWGRQVNGNSWRTTGDIEDNWRSLYNIGFKQDTLYPYAGPGGWNDPDMLVVGMVGWGENLHPSRLTPDEQYTHISLWSLLSAPLLIGCDISKLDPFTLNLLSNDEVIAIDQDRLGKQAKKLINKDSVQVYVKELSDGNKAIGIFNTSLIYKKYSMSFIDLGLNDSYDVLDLWREKIYEKNRKTLEVSLPPHGVFLCKIKKNRI